MRIHRIAPFSAAKIGGTIYAAAGLLFGALFSVASLVGFAASGIAGGEGAWAGAAGSLFGLGAIIVLPLFYGAMGFLGMALVAFVYNLAAGWVGGLEVDIS